MTNKNRLSSIALATAIAILFFYSQAMAGLVIERIHSPGINPDKNKATKMVGYFKSNKVKTVEPDGSYTIVDLKTGTVTLVDPQKREYSVTTLDEMLNQMQKGMNRLKAHLEGLNPEQRAMLEKMMGMSQKGKKRLQLKKLADKQRIAGYDAEHFAITQGNKKIAEYWVSKQLRDKILKELDRDKIDKFEKAMSNISSQLNIFGNSNMAELMKMEEKLQKRGEIVKQIHYPSSLNMNMQGSYQEVVSVKEETIPASAFQIPRGFKKAKLE